MQVEDSMKQVTVETILKSSSDRGAIIAWRTSTLIGINDKTHLSIYLSIYCNALTIFIKIFEELLSLWS
jgi:hypothetical protein